MRCVAVVDASDAANEKGWQEALVLSRMVAVGSRVISRGISAKLPNCQTQSMMAVALRTPKANTSSTEFGDTVSLEPPRSRWKK